MKIKFDAELEEAIQFEVEINLIVNFQKFFKIMLDRHGEWLLRLRNDKTYQTVIDGGKML